MISVFLVDACSSVMWVSIGESKCRSAQWIIFVNDFNSHLKEHFINLLLLLIFQHYDLIVYELIYYIKFNVVKNCT